MPRVDDHMVLAEYRRLLEAFLTGDLTAKELESAWLSHRQAHIGAMFDPHVDRVLENFFYAVDAFEGDPELQPDVLYSIDEATFRLRAKEALEELTTATM